MVCEDKITLDQFKKLSGIVYKESGIVINKKKYALLTARLAKRMRLNKISSVFDYIELISSNSNEFTEFIDAITTNHTYFFRENKHCEYIINNMDNTKFIKIWSAASSSGEEPFSIAVQLLANSFSFNIYASDVSGSMLQKCRRAIYPQERVKNVPLPILHTYFQKGINKWQGYVKLKRKVRQYVKFEKHNLLYDIPVNTFDIIFCRNVMIYFDTPTKQKVVDGLCRALNPGGYLFVGMSESLNGLKHELNNILPSGYQKKL